MAKFPHKTPFELGQYFRQQDLSQLIKINREYGPHFVWLEERLDHHNESLKVADERLAQLLESKRVHELTYETVLDEEAGFQQTLGGVLADTNQTDRYLGRQAAGYSPMTAYELKSQYLCTEILRASERVSSLNDGIEDLKQKKTAAVCELRILNQVIEEKQRALEVEQINKVRPSW
ncbi:hypothetical protein OQJ19_12550 [Fluoribacter gormanii]|uniref:Uncharacterized protein n=1 Tax=Fluoribacter gormanii TaxID=464 RepID=A0A377GKV7_9GAMM|nr:hypothetical protein [Fluoribacter gormanii]KTD01818.1 hypothetical protein Lgor_2195 [Fluoribacter gormanii]MCW8442987.1 hypothetical protein [Fluoribacter gormanii]MCW8471471.1 hypothetical protein [Fluoribacter gormanii]SIR21740.1 hypothetical protein SAMN05421777_10863 [Fluoribacter gormanii]STO25411.1 Uncharacterised protein [Fluoribacter gormanii]